MCYEEEPLGKSDFTKGFEKGKAEARKEFLEFLKKLDSSNVAERVLEKIKELEGK